MTKLPVLCLLPLLVAPLTASACLEQDNYTTTEYLVPYVVHVECRGQQMPVGPNEGMFIAPPSTDPSVHRPDVLTPLEALEAGLELTLTEKQLADVMAKAHPEFYASASMQLDATQCGPGEQPVSHVLYGNVVCSNFDSCGDSACVRPGPVCIGTSDAVLDAFYDLAWPELFLLGLSTDICSQKPEASGI